MSFAYNLINVPAELSIVQLIINLQCQMETASLFLKFENSLFYKIHYEWKGEDTIVRLTEFSKLLVRQKDYVEVMCEDLTNIMKSAKFANNFQFGVQYDSDICQNATAMNQICEHFNLCVQPLPAKRTVYSLQLNVKDVVQLCSVFPFFDPKTVTKLTINLDTNCSSFERNDFSELFEMDLWKKGESITLRSLPISIPVKYFTHLQYVDAEVSEITADDIRTFLMVDFDGPRLCCFVMYFKTLNDNVTDQLLDSLIGEKQINQYGEKVRLIGDKREFSVESNNIRINCADLKSDDHKHSFLLRDIVRNNPPRIYSSLRQTLMLPHYSSLCLCNTLIMEKIAQNLEFFDLQVLRKVSHGIRKCIGFLKPDSKLLAVKIDVQHIGEMHLEVFTKSNQKSIKYVAPRLPGLPRIYDKLQEATFLNDILLIFKDQKSELKDLYLNFEQTDETSDTFVEDISKALKSMKLAQISLKERGNRFFWKKLEKRFIEKFKRILISLDRPLKVENLKITTRNSNTVAQILQYLDPCSLNKIEFGCSSPAIGIKQIRKLTSLEHWKSAEGLKIETIVEKCEMTNLIHFSKVDIILNLFSLEDVLYLKEKLLSSPSFRQFKIKFVASDVDESIFEVRFLGRPFRIVDDPSRNQPNVWFFQYTGETDDLQIRYYQNFKKFMFSRVEKQDRFLI